jgi:1,2-diacylglycerol 3-alpha-glucosyltransferase
MDRIKIICVQRIFTEYRKPIFDRLSEKYDIKVLHSENSSGINQINTRYSSIIKKVQFTNNPTNVFLFTLKCVAKIKPKVIIHENSIGIASLPFLILYCRIKGIKIILWGHGYNRFYGFNPQKSILDKIRLLYMKFSSANLFYGQEGRNKMKNFIDKNKLFVAQNTLDTDYLLKIKEKLKLEGKENIKCKLGITNKHNFIFIGRLLKSKSPEKLLNLFQKLVELKISDVGIHFIGDGEMINELKLRINNMGFNDNFFFHGAIFDDELTAKYLFVSDLMIMPGYLGLSIVHSFCFDCPVVSFETNNHSPEIEYLISNHTGYLAELDNYDEMANWIENYLNDMNLQKKIKKNITEMILNNCSIEKMVNGIDESLKFVLTLK